jgi:anti-anti-sigma factor
MAQIRVADQGDERWIHLEGELDQSDVLDMKQAFDDAVRGSPGDVVIDLKKVTFLSTLGIGLIVWAQDLLEELGSVLRLAHVPDFIERTLRTMNLDEIFERA